MTDVNKFLSTENLRFLRNVSQHRIRWGPLKIMCVLVGRLWPRIRVYICGYWLSNDKSSKNMTVSRYNFTIWKSSLVKRLNKLRTKYINNIWCLVIRKMISIIYIATLYGFKILCKNVASGKYSRFCKPLKPDNK